MIWIPLMIGGAALVVMVGRVMYELFEAQKAGREIERRVEAAGLYKPAVKDLSKRPKKPKAIGYKPKEGYVWNPLLKIPRNSPCPCGSLMKFKHCHLKGMPRVLDPHSIPVPKAK